MQRENYTIQKNYHKNKKNVSEIKRFILLPYCIQIHTLISKITSCDRNFQIWWDWITRCVKWDFTGHFRSLVTWKIITRYQKEIIERYILKTNVIKYLIYGLILNFKFDFRMFNFLSTTFLGSFSKNTWTALAKNQSIFCWSEETRFKCLL